MDLIMRRHIFCVLAFALCLMEMISMAAHSNASTTEKARVEFGRPGKSLIISEDSTCYNKAVAEVVATLESSDDAFDMAVNSLTLEKFRSTEPWVEVIFDKPLEIRVGFIKEFKTVRKILIIFKQERPRFIFFAAEDYLEDDNVAANTHSGVELYDLLDRCANSP